MIVQEAIWMVEMTHRGLGEWRLMPRLGTFYTRKRAREMMVYHRDCANRIPLLSGGRYRIVKFERDK